MTDPRDPHEPTGITDLPLQPTGSGVADTEIARMQDELAEGGPDPAPDVVTTDRAARDPDAITDGDAY